MSARPAPSRDRQRVTVVGAGIVGVCCARFLQRSGFAVTVVDRGEPGRGTSFGNMGMLCAVEHALPLPSMDVLRSVPRMLLDPSSPLAIRWRYLPRLMPWLMRFVANAPEAKRMRNARALASLMKDTLSAYGRLVEGSDASRFIRHLGSVDVFKSEAALAKDKPERERMRSLGVRIDELDGDELHQLEPAISRDYRHGIYFPDCGHCLDPFRLTRAIADDVRAAGGRFVQAEVRGVEVGDGGVRRLLTSADPIEVETMVLAAGAWSGGIAKALGSPVPLDTERGYHTVLNGVEGGIQRPVVEGEASVGLTQMVDGLRIGGTVELASLDAPPNYERARMFYERGRAVLPDLPPTESIELTRWMGFRPTLPDYLPALGPSPHHRNVWFAFGHQHLGLSLAARTGELIATLVRGEPTDIDTTPFRIDRFRR